MFPLIINKQITFDNKKFTVVGKVMYECQDGSVYEEFLMTSNDSQSSYHWIELADGNFIYYASKEEVDYTEAKFFDLRVGEKRVVAKKEIFITNKYISTVTGVEGNFPFKIEVGEKLEIVEGIFSGHLVSLEFNGGDCEISLGKTIVFPVS